MWRHNGGVSILLLMGGTGWWRYCLGAFKVTRNSYFNHLWKQHDCDCRRLLGANVELALVRVKPCWEGKQNWVREEGANGNSTHSYLHFTYSAAPSSLKTCLSEDLPLWLQKHICLSVPPAENACACSCSCWFRYQALSNPELLIWQDGAFEGISISREEIQLLPREDEEREREWRQMNVVLGGGSFMSL